jgi:hypothetical protein
MITSGIEMRDGKPCPWIRGDKEDVYSTPWEACKMTKEEFYARVIAARSPVKTAK